jgi:hypothetical protein
VQRGIGGQARQASGLSRRPIASTGEPEREAGDDRWIGGTRVACHDGIQACDPMRGRFHHRHGHQERRQQPRVQDRPVAIGRRARQVERGHRLHASTGLDHESAEVERDVHPVSLLHRQLVRRAQRIGGRLGTVGHAQTATEFGIHLRPQVGHRRLGGRPL